MKRHNKSLDDTKHASENGRGTGTNKELNTDGLFAGESRRRFVKGTLAAAPVLMTVVSRPAWGNACAPSGMVSGNLSSPGAEVDCSEGVLTPDDYVQYVLPIDENDGEWELKENFPSSEDSFAITFQVPEPDKKLKQILINTVEGSDPVLGDWEYGEFYRAAVVAYANAELAYTDYLSTYMVQCMVHDIITVGEYLVAPGCPWYLGDVLDYFRYTWGEGPLTI